MVFYLFLNFNFFSGWNWPTSKVNSRGMQLISGFQAQVAELSSEGLTPRGRLWSCWVKSTTCCFHESKSHLSSNFVYYFFKAGFYFPCHDLTRNIFFPHSIITTNSKSKDYNHHCTILFYSLLIQIYLFFTYTKIEYLSVHLDEYIIYQALASHYLWRESIKS